jgi:hypothetical protein
MTRLFVRRWLPLGLAIAAVSLVVDQNTGDETGPPYHDPLINQISFFVFFGTCLLLVATTAVVIGLSIRRHFKGDATPG